MPKLLDLFCCEGGASYGYALAGFDVYGVDISAQPRYPYPFHRGDALEVIARLVAGESVAFAYRLGAVEHLSLDDFAAIAASPPCQAYSVTKHSHSNEHPDLLAPTRDALDQTGLPYIIENVPGAPLRDPLTLCGSMFGLKAPDTDGTVLALRRHRLFESNVWLMGAGGCSHDSTPVGGSYGGGRHKRPEDRDNKSRRGGYAPATSVRAELIGANWMTRHGLAQAIPPAYTEFLGRQLLDSLAVAVGHESHDSEECPGCLTQRSDVHAGWCDALTEADQ